MEGFTSKGLVILPDKEYYYNLPHICKEWFVKSVELLPQVFESNYGIRLFYFNTNVIREVPMPKSMLEIFCLCHGDIDFLNGVFKDKNMHEYVCDDAGQFKHDEYNNLREKVRNRYPVEQGMAQDRRIAIIEKREKTLAGLIAQKFSLIITFERPSKRNYDISIKKFDGRILLQIDMPTMTAQGFISRKSVDVVSLMNRPWAFKKVCEWEVKQ